MSMLTWQIHVSKSGPWWTDLKNSQRDLHQIQITITYDDVIEWKHFRSYSPFVRGIHRWPVNSPHKGQWHRALFFFFDMHLIKRLGKQSRRRWFETPSHWLCRHCDGNTVCEMGAPFRDPCVTQPICIFLQIWLCWWLTGIQTFVSGRAWFMVVYTVAFGILLIRIHIYFRQTYW